MEKLERKYKVSLKKSPYVCLDVFFSAQEEVFH